MSEPMLEPASAIPTIREALRAALEDIPGLNQLSAYAITNPTPPCIDIYPGDPFDENRAFRDGFGAYLFTVRARTGTMSDENAQRTLDYLLEREGPTSIRDALAADKTLAGTVDRIKVGNPSGYRQFPSDPGGADYLGAVWQVEVLKTT